MIYRKVKLMILSTALLSASLVMAHDWKPVGSSVNDEGFAYDAGGNYVGGDLLSDDAQAPALAKQSFEATAQDKTLNIWGRLFSSSKSNAPVEGPISCALKVDGAIRLTAHDADMTVNIKSPVTFMPYYQGSRSFDGAGFGMLYFDAAQGRTITVNADHSITFQGVTLNADKVTYGAKTVVTPQDGQELDPRHMWVVAHGKGQVIFTMANGVAIKLIGDIDGSSKVDVLTLNENNPELPDMTTNAGGVKFLITMDQSDDEVRKNRSKVVFKRKDYAKAHDKRNLVLVGPNAIMTFIGNDKTGLAHTHDATVGNYAACAFDVSNKGPGRMILMQQGAVVYGWEKGLPPTHPAYFREVDHYLFHDGAVTVAGHHVASYDPGDILVTFNTSVPAGARGILRVTDDAAYAAHSGVYDPSAANVRGLLVLNDAKTVGKYASDSYWDYFNTEARNASFAGKHILKNKLRTRVTPAGNSFAYAAGIEQGQNLRNVRPGFVVGVNGAVEVYHRCFVDYVAMRKNSLDLLAVKDFGLANIMRHNPSAFVFDGLDAELFLLSGELTGDEYDNEKLCKYEAANPFTQASPRKAELRLFGLSSLKARMVADETLGYAKNFWQLDLEPETTDEDGITGGALDNPSIDFDLIFINGAALFDNSDSSLVNLASNNVMEVRGEANIKSFANTEIGDAQKANGFRTYAQEFKQAGNVEMVTTKIDYTGSRFDNRPLQKNTAYAYYGSPAAQLNASLNLFDTTWVHSDVTKAVDVNGINSIPALIGGEETFFFDAVWNFDRDNVVRWRFPELRLYNSTIDIEESLAIAGIRLVVQDIPGYQDKSGDNHSTIRFFNHGYTADVLEGTGYGRILKFGTLGLTMADGSTNWATESAYINVFKRNLPLADKNQSAAVTLSLADADQYPVNAAAREKQQGLHLFLLSKMPQGTVNAALGWTSIHGDASIYPGVYPYATTSYNDQAVYDSLSAQPTDLFLLDALTVPAATLSIDSGIIAFTSFDQNGNTDASFVQGLQESGIIYVNHGGKIATGNNQPQAIFERYVPVKQYPHDVNASAQQVSLVSGVAALNAGNTIFGSAAAVQVLGLDLLGQTPSLTSLQNTADVFLNWQDITTFDTTRAKRLSRPRNTGFLGRMQDRFARQLALRTLEPITSPTGVVTVTAPSDISNLIIAGATAGDPALIRVNAGAKVREFTTKLAAGVLAEGAHARIFAHGGQFGLGAREVSAHDQLPWGRLGAAYIQIIAEKDGSVCHLNSDLLIVDKEPIIASTTFGANQVDRLTFFAETEREIRIMAGAELDLSSFGQAAHRQEIAFDGKIKVVVEPGATIRFPENPTGGVVLYFNGESQLTFESGIDLADGRDSLAPADTRVKIVGKGQIWANKSAAINIFENAVVGVQADAQTPTTDVTVSLNRESSFNIGTSTIAGGAFEVGNPIAVPNAEISFKLVSLSPNATIHIDREGFLGLGAGIIRKAGLINGQAVADQNPVLDENSKAVIDENGKPVFNPDTTNAWQIAAFHDVKQVEIEMQAGSFEHNNIANGSNRDASLLAVGPMLNAIVKINNSEDTLVKGGGNVMLVPAGKTINANIWDYAGTLTDGERYNVLASGPMLLERNLDLSTLVKDSYLAGWEYRFEADMGIFVQDALYNLLAMRNYNEESTKYVPVGLSPEGPCMACTNFDVANVKYLPETSIITRRVFAKVLGSTIEELFDAKSNSTGLGIETDTFGPLSLAAAAA